ncbi:MAG: glycosyltransferase family 4 protein [Deltaproteobacteria bacterium]|jgi:glycosyltransferase involved in cell wall biosynthesis|nr:glycosyltransferase family 4 protein [Deltaproteobacteria bacterium]
MKCKKAKILIIGSLPPPFIGPYIATEKLINTPSIQQSFDILFLNTSDKRNPMNIGRFDIVNCSLAITHITKCLLFLLFKKPCLIYMGISQGLWGVIRDLGFLVPSIILRRKIVIHLRGSEFDSFFRSLSSVIKLIIRLVFKRITNVIILGESLRHVFKDLVEPDKIVVVPNGIDYEQFDQIKRPSLKHHTSGRGILYLSSLLERKGIFRLIEALPIVLERYPEIRVTIAGEWQSLREKEKAFNLIKKNKIDGRINFAGQVSGINKIRLYNEHDVFVFPPIQPEGMPWVILEAMSAKLPVISTNQGTIPEVIEHAKTGYLVEPTPENIADRICYLVDNPAIARKMGEAGRRRVESHFSEKNYFDKLENVFNSAAHNM